MFQNSKNASWECWKKKINLTKSLKGAEKFKKMTEIIKKNFEENFEMKKKNSD